MTDTGGKQTWRRVWDVEWSSVLAESMMNELKEEKERKKGWNKRKKNRLKVSEKKKPKKVLYYYENQGNMATILKD